MIPIAEIPIVIGTMLIGLAVTCVIAETPVIEITTAPFEQMSREEKDAALDRIHEQHRHDLYIRK